MTGVNPKPVQSERLVDWSTDHPDQFAVLQYEDKPPLNLNLLLGTPEEYSIPQEYLYERETN